MEHLTGELVPRAPFDFDRTLAFVGGFSPAAGEQRTESGELAKALSIEDRIVHVAIRSTGSLESPRLRYVATSSAPLGRRHAAALRDRIDFWLSLDDDLAPFYERAATDPPMAALVERVYGLHQPKFPSPFENTVQALIGQRTPMSMARKRKHALIERFGPPIDVAGTVRHAFPSAALLAAAGPAALTDVLRHAVAGPRVAGAAAAFAAVDEAWLRALPTDELAGWLRRLDGIGDWSVSFILSRGFGRMERLHMVDGAMLQAARDAYRQTTLTTTDVMRLANGYGESAGHWAFYLRAADVGRANAERCG